MNCFQCSEGDIPLGGKRGRTVLKSVRKQPLAPLIYDLCKHLPALYCSLSPVSNITGHNIMLIFLNTANKIEGS